MKNKFLRIVSLTLVASMLLTGCNINLKKDKENNDTQIQEKINTETNVVENNVNLGSGEVIKVSEIKAKYGALDTNTQIKPFYNVEQTTEFTFHFNSMVEPCKAITVHTDSKCLESSTVYQINDGYLTDNGLDVVVKPGKPILNSSDRNDDALENYNWGNAPIYYLCIRYDMNTTTPTLLDTPIIVPFTVKSKVSVPSLTCNISPEGEFSLNWLPVENAVSYNIYQANPVRDTEARNMTRAEAGYVGDHLEKLTTVNANVLSFKDFNLDGTNNCLLDNNNYVITQNFYDLGSYYVTAVDASGNESFFSLPITGWLYYKQLPNSFDSYFAFPKDENGYVNNLLGTVQVKMCNDAYNAFPINYTKIKEEYGCAIYKYSIIGTKLTGQITYKNETGVYENEVVSSTQFNYDNYIVENQVRNVPTNDINTIIDDNYANSNMDLATKVQRDESKKLVYSKDALLKRADIENARIVYDGVYPNGSGLDSIPTYLDGSFPNSGQRPNQPISTPTPIQNNDVTNVPTPTISVEPNNNNNNHNITSTPMPTTVPQVETPIPTSNPSIPVEQTPTTTPVPTTNVEPMNTPIPTLPMEIEDVKPTPSITNNPIEEVTPLPTQIVEPTIEPTPISTEEITPISTPIVEPIEPTQVVETTQTPENNGKETVDSSNLVDTQIESTEQQVQEGNEKEIATTSYTVFAENAEQEYLALCMINCQNEIDISAFPSLQNPEYLIDNLLAVIEQNPYILSTVSYGYDYRRQLALVQYDLTKEEINNRQSEIQTKANSIVSNVTNANMTEEEKVHALWKYLEDNTSYDNAALEKAQSSGFLASNLSEYTDSFNTYGIMCKNVGVCSSYGYAFKLLCDVANVDCMRVSGDLNYTLPHAWNIVELNGTWYQLDITNHKNTTGVPYLLYLTSTSYAQQNGWVMNKDFVLDSNFNNYIGADNSKEYYEANNLIANSLQEQAQIVSREILNGNKSGAVRCSNPALDTETRIKEFVSYMIEYGVPMETLQVLKFAWSDTLFLYELP